MDQSGGGGEWGSLTEHLLEGEEPLEEQQVAGAPVAVTDRRLLVGRDDWTRDVRAVDLRNVRAVEYRKTGRRGHLLSAALWTGLGLVLVAVSRVVPSEFLSRPVEPIPGAGFESLFEAVDRLVSLLAYLDTAFLLGAALAVGWAGYRVLRYVRSRNRVLEVTVAGSEPIRFPAPDSPEQAEALRGVLLSDDVE